MPSSPLIALRTRFSEQLQQVRLRLAHPDAQLQLAVLGLFTGLLAGGVIVLFRLGVESTQALMLPGDQPENYEALAPWLRLVLPTLGGLAIGLLFLWTSRGNHLLGVPRIMERLAYHQGYLSLREFLLQFSGAALAIASGHSVGREGPHIFLGAASGSLLGQRLSLPNNTIRTLVGCGTAAAISASFNTPLAGVIFALEVVMMEYSLASFVPVILAAVSADAVSVLVLGSEPAFSVPRLHLGSLAEIPLVLLLGVLVGAIAAGFIQVLESLAARSRELPFWQRTTLAGFLVGACGLLVPEVLGIGYDTVDQALLGNPGIPLLFTLLLFKILATGFSIGLGVPGGLIGPSLFIGSVAGCLTGKLALLVWPHLGSDVGVYALLGMGAMMGASLQAPLAALAAMMELTHNPQIIMPGMLAIVVAGLTSRELFGKASAFVSVLEARGLRVEASPVLQALRRIGVASVMETRFSRHSRHIGRQQADSLLQKQPEWILIEGDGRPLALLRALDLALALEREQGTEFDLLEIPARRLQLAPLPLQATLHEALEQLERSGAEALYVERMTAPGIRPIYGILTREQVESAYRP